MAETQIEWTDATWNPVAGCSVITAGCTHCYAMEMAMRLEAMGVKKYAGLTTKTRKGARLERDRARGPRSSFYPLSLEKAKKNLCKLHE